MASMKPAGKKFGSVMTTYLSPYKLWLLQSPLHF